MFPDATQADMSCTFDGFHDNGDRGEKWFCLVDSEGDGNDSGDWLGEETSGGHSDLRGGRSSRIEFLAQRA